MAKSTPNKSYKPGQPVSAAMGTGMPQHQNPGSGTPVVHSKAPSETGNKPTRIAQTSRRGNSPAQGGNWAACRD